MTPKRASSTKSSAAKSTPSKPARPATTAKAAGSAGKGKAAAALREGQLNRGVIGEFQRPLINKSDPRFF